MPATNNAITQFFAILCYSVFALLRYCGSCSWHYCVICVIAFLMSFALLYFTLLHFALFANNASKHYNANANNAKRNNAITQNANNTIMHFSIKRPFANFGSL